MLRRASRKRTVFSVANGDVALWQYSQNKRGTEAWIKGAKDRERDRAVVMIVRNRQTAERIIAQLTDIFLKE